MKISEIIKDLPNNKRIMIMQKTRTDFLVWENKIIANCLKYELSEKMINFDQATVKHYYENEAFGALVIKVENYWLQKIIEEHQYGKSILRGEKPRKRKLYTGSGVSASGCTYTLPEVFYVEES